MAPKKSKKLQQPQKGVKKGGGGKGPGSSTQVSVPVQMGTIARGGYPSMRSLPNGDCVIKHREYIQDITAGAGAPSAFNVGATIPLNPGQTQSFPWLSTIAARFESYRFLSLSHSYETDAPTTLGGTLVMTTDFDATDDAPTSKQQAMAYRGYTKCPLYGEAGKKVIHRALAEDLHKLKERYVRPGAVPVNTDLKMYDVGNLFVITQGATTASASCGELFVDYEILLMTPVYDNTITTSGTLTGLTSAIATPFLSGTALGAIQLGTQTATPTVLRVVGLVVGQEYQLTYNVVGASVATLTWGTYVGWTIKSTFGAGSVQIASVTLTATATSASAVMTMSAGSAFPWIVIVSQIPTSAL
jgi:hypothetical protein